MATDRPETVSARLHPDGAGTDHDNHRGIVVETAVGKGETGLPGHEMDGRHLDRREQPLTREERELLGGSARDQRR